MFELGVRDVFEVPPSFLYFDVGCAVSFFPLIVGAFLRGWRRWQLKVTSTRRCRHDSVSRLRDAALQFVSYFVRELDVVVDRRQSEIAGDLL